MCLISPVASHKGASPFGASPELRMTELDARVQDVHPAGAPRGIVSVLETTLAGLDGPVGQSVKPPRFRRFRDSSAVFLVDIYRGFDFSIA